MEKIVRITVKWSRHFSGCPAKNHSVLAFWGCLLAALCYSHTACSAAEVHRYREVTGKSVKVVSWQLHQDEMLVLSYSTPTERHVTTTGKNYETTRWEVADSEGETDLVATRSGNTITVEGTIKGEAVRKTLAIDTCPWYQATSLSLRGLIAAPDSEQIFWTIRLETLTAHKLKATKKEVRKIESDRSRKMLQRIRLRPTGVLAPFWKCDYWFTLPYGVLFRFEGPSGPPGSPITIVTRTGS